MTPGRSMSVLALLLLSGSARLAQADAPTSPAPARTGRHLLLALGTVRDYRVPGARYDLVIIAPEGRPAPALHRARQAHPASLVLGYLNTMDMNEQTPFAARHLRRNEEWFLHDASGERVRVRADRYRGDAARFGMNVGHSGYQDFLASLGIRILEEGYDGLHLDNVETDSSYHPSRVGGYISALPVELSHATWPEAERSMLARLRSRVEEAGLGERLLVINQIRSGEPDVSRQYVAEVDGANCEHWLSRRQGHDGRFGWKARVDQAAEIGRTGKLLNLINKTESVTAEESLYLFASYLLAREGDRTYFYHGSAYKPEATRWHEFYDVDIGEPAGAMRLEGGIYSRRFEKGYVAVNPFDQPGSLSLPQGLLDMTFEPVTRLELAPRTGAILLEARGATGAPIEMEAEEGDLLGSAAVQPREGASGGRVVRLPDAAAGIELAVSAPSGRYRLRVDGFADSRAADACFVEAAGERRRIHFAAGHRPWLDVTLPGGDARITVRAAEPGVMVDRLLMIGLPAPAGR